VARDAAGGVGGAGPDGVKEDMAVEFKLTLQDTPGTLARLGTILG
jgi:hypothetical protein